MKRLLLATTKNFFYRQELVKGGYSVTEYNLPLSADHIKEIEGLEPFHAFITEADEELIKTNGPLFDALRDKGNVLCLSGRVDSELKKFLLDHGISNLLQNPRAGLIISYVRIMGQKQSGQYGSMAILDDNDAVKKVLGNIIERFGYDPVFIASVEELFGSAMNSSVRFVLVNLGAPSLDLNGLVRKFYASSYSSAVPVIVYKDMREGLYVHELVGGLNRMTRYILGLDELFSFLVDILFKKELISLVASLRNSSDFDNISSYADEAVSRIFFMHEKSIFNQADILNEKNFEMLFGLSRTLEKTILKALGLRWLKMDMNKKNISTAGRGE
jgi:hypothetical protein